MNSQTRVMVTGGAGFIGSTIVDALIQKGFTVGVLDSMSTGRRENVNPSAVLYEIDILDTAALEQSFQDFQPHVVSHHAAQISVAISAKDPRFDAQQNIIGSLNVLEQSRVSKVDHFVFASTGGALYGNATDLPADEQTSIAPLSPYGVAKAATELYLAMYRDTWAFSYTALRYSNVYGPRQTAHGEAGVIAIFANHMLDGEEPVVFGDGEQARDFIYVDDVARANLLSIEYGLQGAFNVGTGTSISINEMAHQLVSACGYSGSVRHAEQRHGEVHRISLDPTKIANAVGWGPLVTFPEGIRRTVAHYKAQKTGNA